MQLRPEAAPRVTYEVLVRGELSDDLLAELDARSFTPRPGKTAIIVEVIDQSHLHGVIRWLEDHKVDIERVNPV